MQKLIQFHFFTKILVSWFFPLLTGFYSCYLTYRMSPFQKSTQLCLQSAVFSLWKKAMFMPFASPLSLSTLPLHFLPSCSLWPAALLSPAHCPDYQCRHLSLLDIPAKHKSLSLPCDSVAHVSPSSLTNSMRQPLLLRLPLPLLASPPTNMPQALLLLLTFHLSVCQKDISQYFMPKLASYLYWSDSRIPCRIGHRVDY